MAHAGDLSYGHDENMRPGAGSGNGHRAAGAGFRRFSGRGSGQSPQALLESGSFAGPDPVIAANLLNRKQDQLVQVLVRDNNVDQAMKALKKKLQREGVFREMKLRNFYEKPSEKRAREKAEAIRRARKLARKRAQREAGIVTAPKK